VYTLALASMRAIRVPFGVSLILAILLASTSCGGGGGSSSNPGNPGSGGGTGGGGNGSTLGITLDSSNVSVAAGGNAIVKLTVTLPSGASSASGTVTGLPSGVNVFPAVPLQLFAGTQNVVLSTTALAAIGTYPITFQASIGNQTVSANANFVVSQGPPAAPSGPPFILALTPNGTTSFILYCVSASGGACSLNVSVSGLPAGVSITPSLTFPIDQNGTYVQLTATASVQPADYIVLFTGSGSGFTSTLPVDLKVAFAGFTVTGVDNQYAVRFGSSTQIPIRTIANVIAGQITNYSVQFSISGLPTGVTASFSPSMITPGQNTTLTLTAAPDAPLTRNVRLQITATPNVNAAAMTVSFLLDVVPPSGQLPTSRSDFVATYGDIVSAVYDPVHKLVFASDNLWNRIEVYSPDQKKIIDTISIPAPENLEMSVDGSKILTGTDTNQVFWIDTATREVVRTAIFNVPNVPAGVRAASPHELSNGKILMQYSGSIPGIVLWDPAAGITSTIPQLTIGGAIARSGDGSKVLIVTESSAPTAYLYDAQSNAISATLNNIFGPPAANQNGTRFILGSNIYDASLNKLGSVAPASQVIQIKGSLFSPDGSIAYLAAESNQGDAIYSTSVSSLALLSTAPVVQLSFAFGSGPLAMTTPFAADPTGLIFGGSDYGMFVDDATVNVGLPQFGFSGMVSPKVGPVGSTTTVTVSGLVPLLPDVYLGGEAASSVTSGLAGQIQFGTPTNLSAGPADLKMFFPSGAIDFAPQAFSFGPSIQFLSGNAGSTTGGSTLQIVGTGISDPAQMQVAIGGKNAAVTSVNSFLSSGGHFGNVYPFPTYVLTTSVPAGSAGAADVTLSTPNGTATVHGGFHYVAVTTYPSADKFSDIIYDRFRNQLYLSAGDHIDVFSIANGSFTSPLTPPANGNQKVFSALALTPDGASLLAIDAADNSLAVYDIDVPSSSRVLSLSCSQSQTGLAITADGRALTMANFSSASCPSGSPASGILSINLTTGTTAELSAPAQCLGGSMRATNDGAEVAFSSNRGFCVLDTATSNFTINNIAGNTAVAASGDGYAFASGPYVTDAATNAIGYYQLPQLYLQNPFAASPLLFEALGEPGSLLYVPFNSWIDIFDVNRGDLRERVSVGQALQPTASGLMSIDSSGQNIFVITAQGLTRVQLDAAPLSIGHVSPAIAAAGTALTIRGTGFKSGSTVTLNGTSTGTTLIDDQTLTVVVPPAVATGPVIVNVTNPGGDSYSLRSAFIMQ
jgi:hypothetical protein